jgi:hypothetical protein
MHESIHWQMQSKLDLLEVDQFQEFLRNQLNHQNSNSYMALQLKISQPFPEEVAALPEMEVQGTGSFLNA